MEAKVLGDPTPWRFSAAGDASGPRFYRPEDMSQIRFEHNFGFDYEQYRFVPRYPLPFGICVTAPVGSDLSELQLNPSKVVLELDGRSYVPSRTGDAKKRVLPEFAIGKPPPPGRLETCWPMEFPVHFRDRETPFTVTVTGFSLRGEPVKLPPIRFAYNGAPIAACVLLSCLGH